MKLESTKAVTKKKLPKLESTPVKFWHDDEHEIDVVLKLQEGQSKADVFFGKLKEMVGVKDTELALNIIDVGAAAIEPLVKKDDQLNVIAQRLHDFGPTNAVEASLVVQASALFTHGMESLRHSATADTLSHGEHYANKAIKLLRLHNETVEALNRCRRGGEQKIVVQHNVVAGQAVVNFPGVGGDNKENGGENPCSRDYAEPKQEPMAIGHVGNPPWPMGGVDSMEENALVQKRKRAKKE
jgi:hypothetical protein